MKTPTMITCTGYGNSGSSAGTNLLEEFSCVYSFTNDFECTFLHETDGVGDLELALTEGHRLKIDLAVKRFLRLSEALSNDANYKSFFNGKFLQYSREYIDELITVKWKGNWHRAFEGAPSTEIDRFRVDVAREIYRHSIAKKSYDLYEPDAWMPEYKPFIDEYYSPSLAEQSEKERFLNLTRKYTAKLFSQIPLKANHRYILVDQLLPPSDMSRYSRYFDSVKTLIIDRDPRDLFACNKADWGSRYIPSSNSDDFIRWYSSSRRVRDLDPNKDDCALFVQFESLVYDYDSAVERIRYFIGLEESEHTGKGASFKPELSKQNTQLFRRYPAFSEDIAKIEKELSNFCYRYEQKDIRRFENEIDDRPNIDAILAPADAVQSGTGTVADSGVSRWKIAASLTRSALRFRRVRDKTGLRQIKTFIEGCLFGFVFPIEFAVLQAKILKLDADARRRQ